MGAMPGPRAGSLPCERRGVIAHPTPERNSYLVLTLDFSPVSTGGDPEAIHRSFTTTVKNWVRMFLMRYRGRFPDFARLEDQLDTYQDAAGLIGAILFAGAKSVLFRPWPPPPAKKRRTVERAPEGPRKSKRPRKKKPLV